MRWFVFVGLAAAVSAGCWSMQEIVVGNATDTDTDSDTNTDTDTDPVECNLGEHIGDFTIGTQSDVATLAGYTSISGNLHIYCPSCTDLNALICLNSLGGNLEI